MIPVDPDARTTLVLNKNYQASGRFFTARAAIRHMINGRVKGIDAVGNCVSWNGSDVEDLSGEGSSLSWVDATVELYPDQPCLRSAPNGLTGNETQWPVPTMVVCTHHFGYYSRRDHNVSLRTIYNMYRGQCQYCLEKIPYSAATKDHVFPKSLGGSNDTFNLVLACRPCNSAKDSSFPFYNANGEQVKPRSLSHFMNIIPEGIPIREEWKQFLFMK